MSEPEGFEEFMREARPRLWQALVPLRGPAVADEAVGDALSWAWEHWADVVAMQNPVGYLYVTARRQVLRERRPAYLPAPPPSALPEVEPGLVPALARLTEQQRTVVWLVDACGWGLTETAVVLGVSLSAVRKHRARGLAKLRSHLEVRLDAAD